MEKRKVLRQRSVDKEAEKAKRRKTLHTNILKLLKKGDDELTVEERDLLEDHDELVQDLRTKLNERIEKKDRTKEWEEDIQLLKKKCAKLADAIEKSKRLVVYTGAGISTSANIPDYRGPNGVWTLLDQGKEIAACDLGLAQPTTAHMALYMLYRQGKISHIVSQNCDGLHLRSGIPRNKLSEVHGNMFIEVCKTCKPVRPYVRLFDVTERTNRFRHNTRRRCYICGSGLLDTIVHFGERGSIAWPINWNGASRAAEKADMILCLGSSLKVLRRYPWLWCMDRPVKQRPPLYIVNLQWTPKDSAATLKLNGRCDFVMAEVLRLLRMRIPEYTPYNDPLLSYATHLDEREEHTTTRRTLIESKPVGVSHISMQAKVSASGLIKEVICHTTFTSATNQFSSPARYPRTSSDERNSSESSTSSSANSRDSSGERSSSTSSSSSSSSSSSTSSSSSSSSSSSALTASDHEDKKNGVIKAESKTEPDESLSSCDINPPLSPRRESQCGRNHFPSPDHTYAISPLKVEPPDHIPKLLLDAAALAPVANVPGRYRLREKRNQKYSQFDEEYFIMCQEKISQENEKEEEVKRAKVVKKVQEELRERKENRQIKEIEYRTIEWPKDALYFSYEPNFLFLDKEEESYVCECCDPAKKKKGSESSEEENSELEQDEAMGPEVDEDSLETPDQSEPEDPKPPQAPGWFGKGRKCRTAKKK